MAPGADLYARNGNGDCSNSEVSLTASMACLAGNLIRCRNVEGRDVVNRSRPPFGYGVPWVPCPGGQPGSEADNPS